MSTVAKLFGVEGQVAFVTGAASGLGLAATEALARAGAHVAMADIDAEGLEREAARLLDEGLRVSTHELDVADGPRIHRVVDEVARQHGRLDMCFANAGVTSGPSYAMSPEGKLANLSPERWEANLRVNLTGAWETVRAAAAPMQRQRSGSVVVTASISGMKASPVSGYPYVAAKAALINLVRHAAVELGEDNVRVNAIAPGVIVTNIAGGAMRDPARANSMAETIPLRRVGQPMEVGGVVLFLLSPASSYVTGTLLPIDGGMTAA